MNTSELIISVSGVRGVVGQTLTAEVALRFGKALGALLWERRDGTGGSGDSPGPRVAVGRDSRPSGPMIQSALTAGLLSAGVHVTDLGLASTPSIALMVRFLGVDAGVVITASHNPSEYNGLKFLGPDGLGFSAPMMEHLRQIVVDPAPNENTPVAVHDIGRFSTDSRAHAHHVREILANVDARAIAEHRYRVVLDSINGAGCVVAPMLLGKLGVELIHVNGEATGRFAHAPEPTRDNLSQLGAVVTRHRAAIGFAQDPDADRLAIVDERGHYIGEEYTLALATYHRLKRLKHWGGGAGKTPAGSTAAGSTGSPAPADMPPTVVCNLSTSRMIDDLAAGLGSRVVRTPVGEANVAGKMLEIGAAIGGEGNGGVIDPRIGRGRDSFIAMALILELLTHTQKTVSELVAEIPTYAMLKTKFHATRAQSVALLADVRRQFAAQKMDLQDGVRIDWPEGWLHVRPSNTEPIVRVIAEARDEATARELISRVSIPAAE